MKVRGALVGAVALFALAAVPLVQAAPPSDAHDRQAAVATLPDAFERAVSQAQANVGAPVQDAHDRQPAPQRPTIVEGPGGFDWGDAAIGAVSGMGFALLLAGLGLLAVTQRSKTTVAMR